MRKRSLPRAKTEARLHPAALKKGRPQGNSIEAGAFLDAISHTTQRPMPQSAFKLPCFSVHLRNSTRSFDDLIGQYQADPASVFDRAMQMAEELRSKADYRGFSIVIVNDSGKEVAQVPIASNNSRAA